MAVSGTKRQLAAARSDANIKTGYPCPELIASTGGIRTRHALR
jgi:hypothetical protein